MKNTKLLRFFIMYLLIGAGMVQPGTHAQCIIPDSLMTGFSLSGHNYLLVMMNKTWSQAVTCAKSKGGYLAAINSSTEQSIIVNFINGLHPQIDLAKTIAIDGGGASYVWLGGSDAFVEGDWRWAGGGDSTAPLFYKGTYPTGTAQGGNYTNWGNEPDNFGGVQDALGLALTNWPLGNAGQWNDLTPADTLFFLIEIEASTGMQKLIPQTPTIYPNPVNQHLSVRTDLIQPLVQVISTDGRLVYKGQWNQSNGIVQTDQWDNGIYLMLMEDAEGNSASPVKVIVHHD